MKNALLRLTIASVALSMLSSGAQVTSPQAGTASPTPSSTTSKVPSTTGSTLTADQAQAALDFHNAKRAEVGTPPLQWSPQLAIVAQTWADHLAKDAHCNLQHSQSNNFGENLFGGSGKTYTAVEASQAWYDEKPKYTGDPLTPANFHPIGHYTQMVWRSTTQLGMGVATCNGAQVIVAEYSPAGNMMGEKPY